MSLATAARSLCLYSTQGAALGSNMIAICSSTTVNVGVTIFALCGPVGVLVGFEATMFLSATGVGIFDRGPRAAREIPAEGAVFPYI